MKTTKYKIRDRFVIKQGRDVFHGGDVIELTDQEAQLHAHKIEPAEPPKKPAKQADKAAQ